MGLKCPDTPKLYATPSVRTIKLFNELIWRFLVNSHKEANIVAAKKKKENILFKTIDQHMTNHSKELFVIIFVNCSLKSNCPHHISYVLLLITHDIHNLFDKKHVKGTPLLERILSDRKQGVAVNWQCTIVLISLQGPAKLQ